MKGKLVDLKSILVEEGLSSGYSFRGKIAHIHNGGVRIVQLKDFENNYTTIGSECILIAGDKIKSKYYLKDGDILFTAKGTNNYAVVYKDRDDTPTIASSALFVIKVDKTRANPYYIAWYINQNTVQNYFKTNETGTYVTSVNKTVIAESPISLPTMEIQNKIAKITSLHLREKRLGAEITDLKNKIITTQLLNIL